MKTVPHTEKSAELSTCGRYRYSLVRRWSAEPVLQWVMLNPSTADDTLDDPTIRRCIGFARREGYGGIAVSNLFALRSTDPRALRADDALDEHNLGRLRGMDGLVVCGWGGGISHARTKADVAIDALRTSSAMLYSLGITKDRQPKHPLYVAGITPFEPWVI